MGWKVVTLRPLYPRECETRYRFAVGWVGPTAGLDCAESLAPTGIRSPYRPARSESLYRLTYPNTRQGNDNDAVITERRKGTRLKVQYHYEL
jgi:hypothetical protein